MSAPPFPHPISSTASVGSMEKVPKTASKSGPPESLYQDDLAWSSPKPSTLTPRTSTPFHAIIITCKACLRSVREPVTSKDTNRSLLLTLIEPLYRLPRKHPEPRPQSSSADSARETRLPGCLATGRRKSLLTDHHPLRRFARPRHFSRTIAA